MVVAAKLEEVLTAAVEPELVTAAVDATELVLDTRTRRMRRFTRPADPYVVSGVPPLAGL